jgi:hypothetical protein
LAVYVTGANGRETAICRSLELARAVFAAAIAEKPAGRFMIRHRIHVGGRLVRAAAFDCRLALTNQQLKKSTNRVPSGQRESSGMAKRHRMPHPVTAYRRLARHPDFRVMYYAALLAKFDEKAEELIEIAFKRSFGTRQLPSTGLLSHR